MMEDEARDNERGRLERVLSEVKELSDGQLMAVLGEVTTRLRERGATLGWFMRDMGEGTNHMLAAASLEDLRELERAVQDEVKRRGSS